MEECRQFIKTKREARHLNTLERERNKLERLCQKNKDAESGRSNIQHVDHNNKVNKNTRQRNDTTNTTPTLEDTRDIKWVRNTSSKPLTEAQVKLLSHGPNYAVELCKEATDHRIYCCHRKSMYIITTRQGGRIKRRGEG